MLVTHKQKRSLSNLKRKANYILDFRGSISSISLLKMTRIFKEMKAGQIIEIIGSDPDIEKDILKVLPESSYEMILMDVVEDEENFHQVQIKKRH
jgi:TusA-related sulfurtransferase